MFPLDKFRDQLTQRIGQEQFASEVDRVTSDIITAQRAQAESALFSQQQAINTSQERTTWRDVKFRSRQRNKVYDKNKSMDSGLNEFPIDRATKFLEQGSHSVKTALNG